MLVAAVPPSGVPFGQNIAPINWAKVRLFPAALVGWWLFLVKASNDRPPPIPREVIDHRGRHCRAVQAIAEGLICLTEIKVLFAHSN
jgi:hypothetical protein